MTDKSVAERMHKDFKIVFTSGPDTARLQVSGPISTQDELDAVTAALVVMRDWLPAQGIEAQRAATAKQGAVEDESPVGNADAPKDSSGSPQ